MAKKAYLSSADTQKAYELKYDHGMKAGEIAEKLNVDEVVVHKLFNWGGVTYATHIDQ